MNGRRLWTATGWIAASGSVKASRHRRHCGAQRRQPPEGVSYGAGRNELAVDLLQPTWGYGDGVTDAQKAADSDDDV
jgi:hypothetical protein